jgi:hypothetical protein
MINEASWTFGAFAVKKILSYARKFGSSQSIYIYVSNVHVYFGELVCFLLAQHMHFLCETLCTYAFLNFIFVNILLLPHEL